METELIEKFFRKECTPHEARQVALYLKANPQVLEKYMSIEEWQSAGKKLMPEDFWNATWNSVQKKNKKQTIIAAIKRTTAVAASTILVASVVYYFYPSQKTINEPVITAAFQPTTKPVSVTNTTNKILKIVLQDSSVISLSPLSTVQYHVPFPADKREIFLEGEAEFHVAKNKKKPFTVYAGAFATTALGTIFSVKKSAGKNIISVRLLQGKVVIHSTDNNLKGWKNDVYLLPGEALKFNGQSAILTVEKMGSINKTIAAIKIYSEKNDSAKNQLKFSNTLLPEVMNKLSAYYKVNIKFDTLLIDTMNFTGTITKNDSLPVILKAIAQMNDLEISKNDNNDFIILKRQ